MNKAEAYKIIGNIDFKKLTDDEHTAILTVCSELNTIKRLFLNHPPKEKKTPQLVYEEIKNADLEEIALEISQTLDFINTIKEILGITDEELLDKLSKSENL